MLRIQLQIVGQSDIQFRHSLLNPLAEQSFEFDLALLLLRVERLVGRIRSRMKVYLVSTDAQVLQGVEKIALAHPATLQVTVNPFRHGEAARPQPAFHVSGQAAELNREECLLAHAGTIEPEVE